MTNEKFSFITIKMLGDNESQIGPGIADASIFCKSAFVLQLDHVIGPVADDLDTTKLGELWSDVLPKEGIYTFEIATVLPFYVPAFEEKHDFVVSARGSELFVSSRMIQCFFSFNKTSAVPLQYYLVHRLGLESLTEQKGITHIHPVPLKTFVSKQIKVAGSNARDCIQQNFNSWVEDFVGDVTLLLDSVRAASPRDAKHALPLSAPSSFSIFWLGVCGDADKGGAAQFSADLPSVAFRPTSNLDKTSMQRVRYFLSADNEIPVHDSAMALAVTYLHYGYRGLAVVQVCIACESVLAKSYETFLVSRGVSKIKYSDAERDISFSQLLNLHLAAAHDLSQLDKCEEILSRLNLARKWRNDVVHRGELPSRVTKKEVEQSIDAASELIRFVLKEDGTNTP